LNILEDLKLSITVARFQELDSNWDTENFNFSFRNFIPFGRLYFPVEGEGFIYYDDREYHMERGRLFLIPAYANAKVKCPERLVKYWCHFNAVPSGARIDFFQLYQPELMLEVENMEVTENLFRRLTEICHNYRGPTAPAEKFEAEHLLGVLVAPFIKSAAALQQKVIGKSDKFTEVIIYIEENLSRHFSLGEIASKFNMNPNYLSNFFCARKGIPLMSYCNIRRIERSMDLMWNTKYNISEIAYDLGFRDIANFSRTFKKYTGQSPSVYRKKIMSAL